VRIKPQSWVLSLALDMPWKSKWSIEIPVQCLSTYVFKSPHGQLPDKPVLIDAEKPEYHLTHHSYREWSKRFAAGLRKAGFKPGDRLLLYSGNSVFFPVIIQGTVMAGGIFTGANPAYVARELAYQLQDSGATFLITAEGSLDTALEATSSIKFPKDRIFVMGDGFEVFENRAKPVRGIRHWTTILASPSEGSAFEWEEFTTRDQMNRTAVLNYSSGTTGVPKGVEITHLNYISNCMQTEHTAQQDPDYANYLTRASILSFLPMYHAYGQTYHGVSAVLKGIPVYMMRKFDFLKMLEYLQKYKITSLNLVPPIAVALIKRPEVKNYDLSTVEAAGVGAAPLDPETINQFERMFGNKFQLKQGWGMTEITCSACGWDPNDSAESDKVGELNANVEAMIVDDDGKEVKDGERGELWVRAPNVMKGYWRKPEATKETLTEDGYLKTGDIAIMHADKKLSIVDRKKVRRMSMNL
jgi:4-coumarate--CoA ligase